MNLNDFSNKQLNDIIDCLNPDWVPITDEYMVRNDRTSGLFTRAFKTTSGTSSLFWRVHFGTPKTVKTVFENIQRMQ